MRIACVGKGGSGKTTVTSLLVRVLQAEGTRVLAVDADINQHLAAALGVAVEPRPIGHHQSELASHLVGTNPRIDASRFIKTTPPGAGSHLVRLTSADPVVRAFASEVAPEYWFMVTGEPEAQDVGVSCFHAKTGAIEALLNHLDDAPDDAVVVDMTAGADAFASGLFTRFDLTIVVVEPTQRALGVWCQYAERAREFGVELVVVANKCEDDTDEAFIRDAVGDAWVATISRSAFIRASERGATPSLAELEPANRIAIEACIENARAVPPDRDQMYRVGLEFHRRNATEWANAQFGADLTTQIDPTFAWPVRQWATT